MKIRIFPPRLILSMAWVPCWDITRPGKPTAGETWWSACSFWQGPCWFPVWALFRFPGLSAAWTGRDRRQDNRSAVDRRPAVHPGIAGGPGGLRQLEKGVASMNAVLLVVIARVSRPGVGMKSSR